MFLVLHKLLVMYVFCEKLFRMLVFFSNDKSWSRIFPRVKKGEEEGQCTLAVECLSELLGQMGEFQGPNNQEFKRKICQWQNNRGFKTQNSKDQKIVDF